MLITPSGLTLHLADRPAETPFGVSGFGLKGMET